MHPAALQWREGSKITRRFGVISQRTLCEKLRRVREVSRLGAHRGQASAVRSNRSENNGRLRVRSEGQLSRKSSKRVQTGEPNLSTRHQTKRGRPIRSSRNRRSVYQRQRSPPYCPAGTRGPTVLMSICWNPILSAGESARSRKSKLPALTNSGSAITEYLSCPPACHSSKLFQIGRAHV